MDKHNTCAIILAAGEGRRMGLDRPKQELLLLGKTVLRHTLEAFEGCEDICSIVIVTREDETEFAKRESQGISKLHAVTIGGTTRALSAACGFRAIPTWCDFVAVHDAARCLISPEMISKVVKNAYIYGSSSAAAAATDTVKIVDTDGFVVSTPPRKQVMLASTPQVFSTYIYNKAISSCDLSGGEITDDNMLVESIGERVYCTDVGKENIKITTRSDLGYAEMLLKGRQIMTKIKIGHGYDVHRLVPERALILGGVDIPHTLGLLGHSDADVLTHAVMDAILGALACGDIGRHFPDSDERYKGISSILLLGEVNKIMQEQGYRIGNVDATVIAQRPKLSPYINEMRANIAKTLNCDEVDINIKATTEERLGFTGSEEGIAVHAVALLEKI